MIVIGERHLHTILREYVEYYNTIRPHLSLDKNSPILRRSQCGSGRILARLILGGLHHEYHRAA